MGGGTGADSASLPYADPFHIFLCPDTGAVSAPPALPCADTDFLDAGPPPEGLASATVAVYLLLFGIAFVSFLTVVLWWMRAADVVRKGE